jgi:23S rRNA pseudouridine1911/1915/1917 synthase
LYGRPPTAPDLARIAQSLGRQALHAAVLGFIHPISAEPLRFEVAPPPDFAAALAALRALA